MQLQRKYNYIMKIVLVGPTAVGKSALLKRFADDDFNDFYISTIGVDFRFKSISIDDFYIKMQIWDTAGQERFKGITKSYYNNADAVILIFDATDPKSFDEIKNIWLHEVRTYCRNNIKIYAMCNKCDSAGEYLQNSQRHFLQNQDIRWFETSAKTGRSVQDSFISIGRQLLKVVPKIEDKELNFELRETHHYEDPSKSKCCQ